ncbi:MAG: hypothetical protein IKS61_00280 [Aeriscardovia sp.]|nr:hypothetical protein [Aeriscardovia sp.]
MEDEDDFDEIMNEFEKQFEEGGEEEDHAGEEEEEGPAGKESPDREQEGEGQKGEEDPFEDLDELSKMAGVKPKSAAIVSGLDKVALCSMCALCEVPAECFKTERGSFAVLDVSKRDPEEDTASLTGLFKGLEVVLILNRDQKLSAKVYRDGKEGKKIAPPLVLYWAPKLESYLVGIEGLKELKEGEACISSSSITKEEALSLLKLAFKS